MRVLSTYTGAGGLDIGFHNVKAEIVAACELNRNACDTYAVNFPNVPLYRGKVTDALEDGFFDTPADVLIGGPPCQGFSVAGKMDPQDPRSLEIFNFLKVLDRAKPSAFVMENVKALATLTKWEFVRERILQESTKSGYFVKMFVLNSANYGVPQRRERVFFIGFSTKERGKRAALAAMKSFEDGLQARLATPKTIEKIVKGLGPAGSQGNSRVCGAKVMFTRRPVLRRSPYAGMLFNGAGRPLDPKGLSSTLPASMGGNKTPIVDEDEIFDGKPSFIVNYHRGLMDGKTAKSGQAPKTLRRLTIDECIAIQTFPHDYDFQGSNSAIFKQIGNAVAPVMGAAVANGIHQGLKHLLANKPPLKLLADSK